MKPGVSVSTKTSEGWSKPQTLNIINGFIESTDGNYFLANNRHWKQHIEELRCDRLQSLRVKNRRRLKRQIGIEVVPRLWQFTFIGSPVFLEHLCEWFPAKQVGVAEGIYGGWGNFGSAAAAMILPTLALMYGGPDGWRYAIGTTGVLALIYSLVYFFSVSDTPKGSTYFKPKKSGALEISSKGDFVLGRSQLFAKLSHVLIGLQIRVGLGNGNQIAQRPGEGGLDLAAAHLGVDRVLRGAGDLDGDRRRRRIPPRRRRLVRRRRTTDSSWGSAHALRVHRPFRGHWRFPGPAVPPPFRRRATRKAGARPTRGGRSAPRGPPDRRRRRPFRSTSTFSRKIFGSNRSWTLIPNRAYLSV